MFLAVQAPSASPRQQQAVSKKDMEIQHHGVGQKVTIYVFFMRYYTVRSQKNTQTVRNPVICLKQGIRWWHELTSCSASLSWSFQHIWAAGKNISICQVFLQILQGECRSLQQGGVVPIIKSIKLFFKLSNGIIYRTRYLFSHFLWLLKT